mgnify:CR=1 FL=1|tara:strand:+ start:1644 stop:1850 length:207 start_codon:yes stop_codon:yes gene_type:complete
MSSTHHGPIGDSPAARKMIKVVMVAGFAVVVLLGTLGWLLEGCEKQSDETREQLLQDTGTMSESVGSP